MTIFVTVRVVVGIGGGVTPKIFALHLLSSDFIVMEVSATGVVKTAIFESLESIEISVKVPDLLIPK